MNVSLSHSSARNLPLTRSAGRAAAGLGLFSLLLVLLLHVIEPEYHPAWRFLSEYANGDFGWIMGTAFFTLALACLALVVALRDDLVGIRARIGAFFLFTAAIGLGLAAFYAMDPITIDPSQATDTGRMHALASMIGVPSLPLSSILLAFGLARRPGWRSVGVGLLVAGGLTLLGLVLIFVAIATQTPAVGGFGPTVIIGWPNRLLMFGFYLWLMLAGWHAASLAAR